SIIRNVVSSILSGSSHALPIGPLDSGPVVGVTVDSLELSEVGPDGRASECRQPPDDDGAVIELNALELRHVRSVAIAAFDVTLGDLGAVADKGPHGRKIGA